MCLHPYRTETTLCVPNPAFSHETRHTFLLDGREPVQKYIMSACGGGLGGGVPFELWRRYYYPNIRDQLVARVIPFNLQLLIKLIYMYMYVIFFVGKSTYG